VTVEYIDWLEEQAAQRLLLAEANVAAGVSCERHVVAGSSTAAGLHDLAEALDADLIVLGRAHGGPVSERFGRHTVQQLLHGAPCAIAVAAPGQARRFDASPRICVAYDGSPESALALAAAYAIAESTGATVVLCYAIERFVFASGYAGGLALGVDEEEERYARAELEAAAAGAPAGVTVEQQALRGTPAEVLGDAACDAALILSGSRGFGDIHRLVAGSTSGALLRHADTSVLVTPRRALAPVS
jgi:nucleotide-binding universal stress UspA family protein